MKPGTIVWVFSEQGWRIGRVVADRQGRLELQHIEGPRQLYPAKRVAHVSAKVVPSQAALAAYRDEVAIMAAEVDLATVWELLDHEAEPTVTHEDAAELALPAGAEAADDAMACAMFDDRIYFRRRRDGRYTVNNGRAVEDRRRRIGEDLEAERQFAEAVAWLVDPTLPRTEPIDEAIDEIKQLVLFEDASKASRHARKLLKTAFPDSRDDETVLAWQFLVKVGIWHEDQNLPVLREELNHVWPEGLLESAADLAAALKVDPEGRVDRRDLVTIAIDDQYTTEVDDALALEDNGDGSSTVHVFIADVAAAVPLEHPVEREAARRMATLYLPEVKTQMLPEIICEEAASLKAGVDRLAMDFALTVADGQITGIEVAECICHVDRRVTYDQTDDVLLRGADHPDAELIKGLFALSEVLRARRREGGSITLDRQEMNVHIEDGVLLAEPFRTDDPGRRLVAEWMIQTCAEVAIWCADNEVPAIFRAQDPPAQKSVIPTDRPLAPHERSRIVRTLRGASLTTDPIPHAGLALACYTQVTSPLRRHADLLMHYQIKAHLQGRRPPLTADQLEHGFAALETRMRTHGQVERASRRYWLLKEMHKRKSEEFEVEVLRDAGRRYVVEILENGLQALWQADGRRSRPGERLRLKIKRVSPRRDRLVMI